MPVKLDLLVGCMVHVPNEHDSVQSKSVETLGKLDSSETGPVGEVVRMPNKPDVIQSQPVATPEKLNSSETEPVGENLILHRVTLMNRKTKFQ